MPGIIQCIRHCKFCNHRILLALTLAVRVLVYLQLAAKRVRQTDAYMG